MRLAHLRRGAVVAALATVCAPFLSPPATASTYDFPVNRTDVNTPRIHTQGPSIGPRTITAATAARVAGSTRTSSGTSTLVGAPQAISPGTTQRAERYLVTEAGRTRHVGAGRTVTYRYRFTPVMLGAADTEGYSWTVVSQLIGPSMRSGAWRAPTSEVAIVVRDRRAYFALAGQHEVETRDGVVRKDGGFLVNTGVRARSGETRAIRFVTRIGGPGVGRTELWIDGQRRAQVFPKYGTSFASYNVVKWGMYTNMRTRRATNDRYAIFDGMRIGVS